VRILRKGKPFWGWGGPALQKRGGGSSWLQTVGEERRSSMATETGDGLATTSRDGYAQSECFVCIVQQLYSITIRKLCLTVLLFQEKKSFGASYHLHSSSDVREVVSSTCTDLML
jgi:hypothetical protein